MRIPRIATAALAALLVLAATPARASGDEGTLDAVHHTADGYYLDFSPIGKIELPRLFVVRRADGSLGFDAFAGTAAAIRSGRYHAVAGDHAGAEAGVHADGEHPEGSDHAAAVPLGQTLEQAHVQASHSDREVSMRLIDTGSHLDAYLVPADGGAVLADLSLSRHLVFLFLACAVVLLLFAPMGGRYKRGVGRTSAPRGLLQNMLETLVIYVRDEIAKPNIGEKHAKYLPYLLTAFFFILTANLLGLVPWGATATANISVTAVLAVFTFVITQFAGTKDYWMHIFWPPGVPTFVKPILVPVEILGLFTKPFALAIRLFANMTAGHLVILNLVGLIFIINGLFGAGPGWGTSVPALGMILFVYALELLVAFIQAYVFTVLSALFIGMATAEHEHHHDDSHAHDLTAHDRAVATSTPLVSGGELRPENGRTVGTEAAISPF